MIKQLNTKPSMKRSYVLQGLTGLLITFLLAGQLGSCKHEPLGIQTLDTVCFTNQVLPIFQTSCTISGCHDAGSANGGFVATNYNSIMKLVKPGKPYESEVYQILGRPYGKMMPPDRPLSKEDRMLIEVWIAQGAENVSCDTSGNPIPPVFNKDSICFVQTILPVLRSSCGITGCHDDITRKEGYVLTSYISLMQKSESIVPFNPDESKIYKVMNASGDDMMPPTGRLPAVQVEAFRKWIQQGALNSDCPQTGCDTTGIISFALQVWPVIQNNCLGCHNSGNANSGVDLSNYTKISLYASTLRNSVPVLSGVINHKSGFVAMPQSGKLDECTIRTIDRWIQQGILNN